MSLLVVRFYPAKFRGFPRNSVGTIADSLWIPTTARRLQEQGRQMRADHHVQDEFAARENRSSRKLGSFPHGPDLPDRGPRLAPMHTRMSSRSKPSDRSDVDRPA